MEKVRFLTGSWLRLGLGCLVFLVFLTLGFLAGYLLGRWQYSDNPGQTGTNRVGVSGGSGYLESPGVRETEGGSLPIQASEQITKSEPSNLELRNVRFRWTKTRYIETDSLFAQAIPFPGETYFDLDRPDSFRLRILQGEARVGFPALEEIFNDSILGYPGAPLRKIKIQNLSIPSESNPSVSEEGLRLVGEMNLGIWLGFVLDTRVIQSGDKIELIPIRIRTLGISYIKSVLDLVKIPLEVLLPIQKGRGAEIVQSKIVVDPFALFRSPGISGNLSKVQVQPKTLIVGFSSPVLPKRPSMPDPKYPNSIFVWGGTVKFGKLRMESAQIQMKDTNINTIFDFYLRLYMKSIAKGKALVGSDGSITVDMPDFFE
jgi:hypothetical protein